MFLMKEDDRNDTAPSSLFVKFKETKGLKFASFAHIFVEKAAGGHRTLRSGLTAKNLINMQLLFLTVRFRYRGRTLGWKSRQKKSDL